MYQVPIFLELKMNQRFLSCSCFSMTAYSLNTLIDSFLSPQDVSHTFSTLLMQSLCFEHNTYTWCEHCKSLQQVTQTKQATTLPNILILHADATPDFMNFWSSVADGMF